MIVNDVFNDENFEEIETEKSNVNKGISSLLNAKIFKDIITYFKEYITFKNEMKDDRKMEDYQLAQMLAGMIGCPFTRDIEDKSLTGTFI